jgi:hypothetical protein
MEILVDEIADKDRDNAHLTNVSGHPLLIFTRFRNEASLVQL